MKRWASTTIGGTSLVRRAPNNSSVTARLPSYFFDHLVVPVIVQLKSSAMLSANGWELPFESAEKICCISFLFSVARITHFSFSLVVSATSSAVQFSVFVPLPAIVHRNRSCDRSVPVLSPIPRFSLRRGCVLYRGSPAFASGICCLALPVRH